jgi:hypothetical protein
MLVDICTLCHEISHKIIDSVFFGGHLDEITDISISHPETLLDLDKTHALDRPTEAIAIASLDLRNIKRN